jgi:hypothetical protein
MIHLRLLLVICCVFPTLLHAQMQTRWTSQVDPAHPLPEYPRPQMVRPEWQNLNGLWEYAITDSSATLPKQYEGTIIVPYPIESALSGVKKSLLPAQRLWYKKILQKPVIQQHEHILLHFGAVDWQATVYVNGKVVGGHTGGYQQFSADITDALKTGDNELVVSVYDPTDQGPNPHGKQVLRPQNILYTASSGIWQTVWMETVPAAYISGLQVTPDIDSGHLRIRVNTSGSTKEDYTLEAIASNGRSVKGKINKALLLPVPDAHHWSPNDPYLYQLNVRLLYKGEVVDTIGSYFGMRKIAVEKGRLFLNNRYMYHLGVLDQGFWPDGLYTAPTDEALQFDIRAIRNMGFNTIRKHIKIEPDRWYYHADKLGVLVWQDMVTCANGNPEAQQEFEKENSENTAQLYNHPAIVIWVLFNEGWARYDQERLTQALKKSDPSRLVNGHSGENYDRNSPENPNDKWAGSDLTDVHEYPGPGLAPALPGKARVLGEWGGVRVATPGHQWNTTEGWGYIQVPAASFADKYAFMLRHLKLYEEEGLSGSIYTQPFDVETEENGLMTYDREVIKIPGEKLRQLHRALQPDAENYAEMLDIKLADTTNPDNQYAILLAQYKQGKKDPEFMKNLALMAVRVNDKENAAKISGEYIKAMSDPYTRANLTFTAQFTKHVMDPGFQFFLKNRDRIDAVLGANQAEQKVMNIIFQDEVMPFLTSQGNTPDWSMFEKHITTLYGDPGEEIYLRARTIHSLNNNDWNNFSAAIVPYIMKYGERVSTSDLNIFGAFVSANADRLYKLGKKEEAIEWQEKALPMVSEKDKPAVKAALQKMKSNQKAP